MGSNGILINNAKKLLSDINNSSDKMPSKDRITKIPGNYGDMFYPDKARRKNVIVDPSNPASKDILEIPDEGGGGPAPSGMNSNAHYDTYSTRKRKSFSGESESDSESVVI